MVKQNFWRGVYEKIITNYGGLSNWKVYFCEYFVQKNDTNVFSRTRSKKCWAITFDFIDDFKSYTEQVRKEKIPGETVYINADDFSYQTNKNI